MPVKLVPRPVIAGGQPAELPSLTGSESQVEWAQRLRPRVGVEFERVARVFEGVASRQKEPDLAETRVIIALVHELRENVMANDEAGYFIRVWQEVKDQVRQMVSQDPRFEAIRANRAMRKAKGV